MSTARQHMHAMIRTLATPRAPWAGCLFRPVGGAATATLREAQAVAARRALHLLTSRTTAARTRSSGPDSAWHTCAQPQSRTFQSSARRWADDKGKSDGKGSGKGGGKGGGSKADSSKGDNSKADNSKADSSKADSSKADSSKADSSKGRSSKSRSSKGNGSKTGGEKLGFSARLKKMTKEYGWTALGVYLGLSVLDFPFCFALVRVVGTEKIAAVEHLVVGLIPEPVKNTWENGMALIRTKEQEKTGDDRVSGKVEMATWGVEEAEKRNKAEASLGTQLALAYAIHKTFIFVRVPLTAAVLPKVVKVLRSWGWKIGRKSK